MKLKMILMRPKLYEQIPYKRVIWTYGFVKTTLSGALISTGVVLIFNGITEHPWFKDFNEVAIVAGFLALICAIIVIISIDKYKEKSKKEELDTIDKQIDERAKKIAEQKILEYMEKIADE